MERIKGRRGKNETRKQGACVRSGGGDGGQPHSWTLNKNVRTKNTEIEKVKNPEA